MKHFLFSLLCMITCIAGRSTVITATWTATSGWTTESENGQLSMSVDDVEIYASQLSGINPPTVNATYGDVRIYANEELVIRTLSGTAINRITFRLSEQGLRRLGTLEVNSGEINVDMSTGILIWTGQSNHIAFKVPTNADLGTDGSSKAAQFAFNSPVVIEIGEIVDSNVTTTIDNAQKLLAGMSVKVEGMVCSTGMSGFLIGDGTGYIYYYNPLAGETYEVGDMISISGTLGNYGGFNQFVEGAVITRLGHVYPEHGQAKKMSSSELDVWVRNPDIQYVEIEGAFYMSGSYYNLAIEGATAIGSLGYSSKKLLNKLEEGKSYIIKGYAFMVTGNSRYINIIATEISEVGQLVDAPEAMHPDVPVGAVCINFTDKTTSVPDDTFSSMTLNGINVLLSDASSVITGDTGYRLLELGNENSITISSANGNSFHNITFGLGENSQLISETGEIITKYKPIWTGDTNKQTFKVKTDGEIFYFIVDYGEGESQENATYRLSVNIPNDAMNERMKGKLLVIENNTTGTSRQMAVVADAKFVMPNLPDGTEVSVYFSDKYGARISTPYITKIAGSNVTLELDENYLPQFVQRNVEIKGSDGTDLTSESKICWQTTSGEDLCNTAVFDDAIAGKDYIVTVSMNDSSSRRYVAPPALLVEASAPSLVTMEALAITDIQLIAMITDSQTGAGIPNVDVTVIQDYDNGDKDQMVVRSDANGMLRLNVKGVATSILISKHDYVETVLTLERGEMANHEVTASGQLDVGEIKLRPLAGTIINLNISYRDRTGTHNEIYPDASRLTYTVVDAETMEILNTVVEFPKIVVIGYDSTDKKLLVTAKSSTETFAPVTVECTPKNGESKADIVLVERGAVHISVASQPSGTVYAMAYNKSGQQIGIAQVSDGEALIRTLPEGCYRILVLQTDEPDVWTRKSMLSDAGLEVEETYLESDDILVTDGVTVETTLGNVPVFDSSSMQYLGSASAVGLNKTVATVGNIVTATVYVDLKEEYASRINDLRLVIALPDGISYIENSSMLNNSPAGYTYDASAGSLEIPIAGNSGKVRFCMTATTGGEKTVNVAAKFHIGGRDIIAPIGLASLVARNLSINVAPVITGEKFTASGECKQDANVTIYDNGSQIGTAKANSLGYWTGQFVLSRPYNGSIHSIQAKMDDPDGGPQLVSKSIDVKINHKQVVATKVTMTNSDHSGHNLHEQTTIFNLQNQCIEGNSYYRFWAAYPDFNFEIEMNDNNNDAAEAVVLLVYTTKDEWRALEAQYNETLGRWTASGKFTASELPVGVKVNILSEDASEIDRTMLSDMDDEFALLMSDYWSIRMSDAEDYVPVEGFDTTTDTEEEMTIDELTALADEMDNLLAEENARLSDLDEIFIETLDGNSDIAARCGVRILEYTEQPAEYWIRLGYSSMNITDGSQIFTRTEGMLVDVIDTGVHQHWQYDMSVAQESVQAQKSLRHSSANVKELQNNISNAIKQISGILGKIKKHYDELMNKCFTLEQIWTEHGKYLDEKIQGYNNLIAKQEEWLGKYRVKLEHTSNPIDKITYEYEISKREEILARSKKALSNFKLDANVTRGSLKNLKYLKGWIGKTIPFVKYTIMVANGNQTLGRMLKVLSFIPDKCECNPDILNNIQGEAVTYGVSLMSYVVGKITIEVFNDLSTAAAMIPSGGTALPFVALKQVIKKIAVDIILDFAAERGFHSWEHSMVRRINEMKKNCNKPCDDDDNDDDNDDHSFFFCECTDMFDCTCNPLTCLCKNCQDIPQPLVDPIQDPSGFVYEGSESVRIEGVKATLYQKKMEEDEYGDMQEVVTIWDAKRFGQENPVLTDAEGYYHWDVPEGMWQVKFDKDGYETVATEWLPVPPPQLDVNIAMKHLVAPTVATVTATSKAITIDFSKFMLCSSVTSAKIFVKQNGSILRGTIEYLNKETNSNGDVVKRIVFKPESTIEGSQVEVLVSKQVESYAGIPMTADYRAVVDVCPELSGLTTLQNIELKTGELVEIEVSAIPTTVGANVEVSAISTSPTVAVVEPAVAVTMPDGKARFSISGRMTGSAKLIFTIPSSGFETSADIMVRPSSIGQVSRPTVSVSPNAPVEIGTPVYLSCSTPDAYILYTTDGSDPSGLTEGVTIYDGTPIEIVKDTEIRAIAQAENMAPSDVVSFRYIVTMSGVENAELNSFEIIIYPNPLRDVMKVKSNNATIRDVFVYDMRGLMLTACHNDAPDWYSEMDVSNLPKGIYLVVIETDCGRTTKKVLKL